MDVVRGMRLFVRVTELESFRKAAIEFDLSAPMVTRSMEMLESHLGVKLLNRSTRSMQLTACGRRYLENCRSWLENLDALESTIPASDGEPKGRLHVALSMTEQLPYISTLIRDFRNIYPKVHVELACIDDADITDSTFDVAIVPASTANASDYSVHPLSEAPIICVASPKYLEQHGTPTTPQDLVSHFHVTLSRDVGAPWSFKTMAGHIERLRFRTAYSVNSANAARDAVLDGMGFALLPEDLIAESLDARRLLAVLPDYPVTNEAVAASLLIPLKKEPSVNANAFVDFTQNYFDKRNDRFEASFGHEPQPESQ
jgi:DNA-binding transcriptional LysR family regulator